MKIPRTTYVDCVLDCTHNSGSFDSSLGIRFGARPEGLENCSTSNGFVPAGGSEYAGIITRFPTMAVVRNSWARISKEKYNINSCYVLIGVTFDRRGRSRKADLFHLDKSKWDRVWLTTCTKRKRKATRVDFEIFKAGVSLFARGWASICGLTPQWVFRDPPNSLQTLSGDAFCLF